MRTTRRRLATLLLLSAVPALSACATSAPAAPSGPVDLDGTKWKLLAIGGALDGRVVQFKKVGKDRASGKLVYLGTLIETGRRLRDVVPDPTGTTMFTLTARGENEYDGIYKDIQPSGNQAEKEVVVFVKPDSLSWNQESAVWQRAQ